MTFLVRLAAVVALVAGLLALTLIVTSGYDLFDEADTGALKETSEEQAMEAEPAEETTTAPQQTILQVMRIVFPEGFTRDQMVERVAAVREIAISERGLTPTMTPKGYLKVTKNAPPPEPFRSEAKGNIEGFLFPATYEFTVKTSAKQLVYKQLAAFNANWAKLDLTKANRRGLTPYQVLIVASMVEKEVRVPRERPLVAAVIYNRLERGMPLGIDATLRYGLKIPPTEPIRQSHLRSPSPFNTRVHTGLPPTPIANPGLASMQAAADPASVDYLYFIRKADCKSHFFTASAAEFESYSRAGLYCGS